MLLTVICIGIALWAIFMGIKFYRRAEWEEPPEFSPDFGQMQKREADLLRIQGVLRQAHEERKLTRGLIEEYDLFIDREIAERAAAEKTWKEKRAKTTPSGLA